MNQYAYYRERSFIGGFRITWAVQRLLLANVLFFAIQLLLEPAQLLITGLVYGEGLLRLGRVETWLGFQADLFVHGYVWKPFTYMFLHGGLSHLLRNMVGLFFFGPDVERLLGTRQFFRFYLLCGAAGVLGTLFPFILAGEAPLIIGASGAVLGVLVAFAIIDPDRQILLLPLPFPITARALVIILIVLNLITALGNNPVSVATHFGGMITGYLYMQLRPWFSAWRRERIRNRSSGKQDKAKPDLDKLGKAVDNIFHFRDRNSGRR
jgi:membrane associated rhomboid family serine protease